jgi:ABC-2 type transport system ATP-binding protein
MRQRLGIAAALLGDPPVLVLDEPGNGLDPQGIRRLRDLLRERATAAGTVFVSSHLLAEVEHLADDVVVINCGHLVATGALSDLQQTGTAVRTPEPDRLMHLLRGVGADIHTDREGVLIVRGVDTVEIGDRACAAGIALHALVPQTGSLEELFLEWTSSDVTPAGAVTATGVTETERQAVSS